MFLTILNKSNTSSKVFELAWRGHVLSFSNLKGYNIFWNKSTVSAPGPALGKMMRLQKGQNILCSKLKKTKII